MLKSSVSRVAELPVCFAFKVKFFCRFNLEFSFRVPRGSIARSGVTKILHAHCG